MDELMQELFEEIKHGDQEHQNWLEGRLKEFASRKKNPTRCIFVTDGDCHNFIIPEEKKKEWFKWQESEDAELGHIPDWAYMLGGGMESVSFILPRNKNELIKI